jgi:hypothetical protein
VYRARVDDEVICGFGMAGPGFGPSPYPKRLAEERAARNLAGMLETFVEEGLIDHQTEASVRTEHARRVQVDEDLVAWVLNNSRSETWIDIAGSGPFGHHDFTYAHLCIDTARAESALHADVSEVRASANDADATPEWMQRIGRQPGDRVCAVGYSAPTFYPEEGFHRVLEDIRVQLAKGLGSFVASYAEDVTSASETIQLTTSEAVSQGTPVSHYWFDRDGIGPHKMPRSTYGWGCTTDTR